MGYSRRARDFSADGDCGWLDGKRAVSPTLLPASCKITAQKSTQTHSLTCQCGSVAGDNIWVYDIEPHISNRDCCVVQRLCLTRVKTSTTFGRGSGAEKFAESRQDLAFSKQGRMEPQVAGRPGIKRAQISTQTGRAGQKGNTTAQ